MPNEEVICMLKFNCSIIPACERRPWCHFIVFENSVEPLMPHIVIDGNYRESTPTKLIDAGRPRWKAVPSLRAAVIHSEELSFSAFPSWTSWALIVAKGPQLAADRQRKHRPKCQGQHVKTTLLQSKQGRKRRRRRIRCHVRVTAFILASLGC